MCKFVKVKGDYLNPRHNINDFKAKAKIAIKF